MSTSFWSQRQPSAATSIPSVSLSQPVTQSSRTTGFPTWQPFQNTESVPAFQHRTGILGSGLGSGLGGKRHRKTFKNSIDRISQGSLRRLARRGGVKRISGHCYHDVRQALKERLRLVLRDCVTYVEHSKRKTITVPDVIFALKRLGYPIYGFGPS